MSSTAKLNPLPSITDLHRSNINFSHLSMSPTLGMNEMQNMLQSQSRSVYKFGFGQSPFPVPSILVDALQKSAHVKDYLPVQGLHALRESICDHLNENILQKHPDLTSDRIIITPGSKQAFFLLKLALSESCEVMLPSPSWVSYHPQSQIIGKEVAWIDTNYETQWKVLPDILDQHLSQNPSKQRLFVLNSPSNPTGVKYSSDELAELANVFRKHRVIVLSDEIYGELCHDANDAYASIYDFYPEGTIITNGISKSFGAGGWRLGYMIFPKHFDWLFDPVFIACSETHTSVTAPVQFAAIEAFKQYKGDAMQNYLKVSRKILKALALKSYHLLSGIDGCNVVLPDGAFYIFPDFTEVPNMDNMIRKWMKETGKSRECWQSSEFSNFLLRETGVASLNGSCFGRPANELSARLSFVDFDGAELLKNVTADMLDGVSVDGIEMDDILNKFCGKTVEGMTVLRDYMMSL